MATDSPHLRASRDGQSPHYWHLAQDSTGVAMTDLEYAILRVFEAFGRWQSECLAAVSGASITGPENVLLHVVAMKGRAKTIHDVMLLTNRQDTPNVQYGLRKLMKLGFIKKRGSARAGVFYHDRKGREGLQGLRRFAEEIAPPRGQERVEIRIDEQKMLFASGDARKNLHHRRPRGGDVLSSLASATDPVSLGRLRGIMPILHDFAVAGRRPERTDTIGRGRQSRSVQSQF